MHRLFILVLAGTVLSCPANTGTEPGETRLAIPADLMGMVHASAVSETENDLLTQYGVKWMLTDFTWGSIQPESKKDAVPEDWNWTGFDNYVAEANAKGKKILAILDYDVAWLHGGWSNPPEFCDNITDSVTGRPVTDVRKYADGHPDRCIVGDDEIAKFCAYAAATVARYNGANGRGKVDAWCIWNEPNLCPRFWTASPEDFFRLTNAAAAAIRQADPDAVIAGGALNTTADNNIWTRGFFTSGAMEQVNAITYHPYMTDAVTSANIFNAFREVVSGYGFGDKTWVTEVGYPTHGNYGTEVDEIYMPVTVAQTLTLLAAGGAKHIFWYHLADPAPGNQDIADSEDWFGLFKNDFTPKGGAHAYGIFANNIPGKTWRYSLPLRSEVPGAIKSYYFEGLDGKHALIIWNRLAISRQITVTLPGTNRQVWDIVNGGSAPVIDETSTWTLENKPDAILRFFTWENSDRSKPPRISAD
jgi:hypothetical protein